MNLEPQISNIQWIAMIFSQATKDLHELSKTLSQV